MNQNEYDIVHKHIETIMPMIEQPAEGKIRSPFLSITMGKTYSTTLFVWDHHHAAMRFACSGRPEYLKYTVDNVLAYQHENGFTPTFINKTIGPSITFPAQPFIMQSTMMFLESTGEIEWVRDNMEKLKRYMDSFETFYGAVMGLYRWPEAYMSGFDNDVVTTFFQPDTILAADLASWIYLEFQAAAAIMNSLGEASDADAYRTRAAKLRQTIHNLLWYEEVESYSAYNLCTDAHQFRLTDDGLNPSVGDYAFQTCSNLIPLYAGIPNEECGRAMLKRYVLSEDHFLSDFGIRSLSRSSEFYNNAIWGNPPRFGNHRRLTNSNWQGPIWIPLCYFMAHALERYGFHDEALDVADRTIHVLAQSLKSIGSFCENFDAETGRPLYAPEFASWNILADQLHRELETGEWIMNPVMDVTF